MVSLLPRWVAACRVALIGVLLCWVALPVQAALQVSDDTGQSLTLAAPARRIVVLAPHLTEDVFAIGAGSQLVGVVDYSDFPAAALDLPRVGGYSGFDLERIRALRPDLIVAWQGGNPVQQLERLKALRIPTYYDDSRTLTDVPRALRRLGVLTGQAAGGEAAARQFETRISSLRSQYASKAPVRVFFQVWSNPLLTINREQIISDAITLCGGVNVFASLPGKVPTVDEEAVRVANPQLIVTTPGPKKGEQPLARWQRWPAMAAVARQQLKTLPPDLLDRMGPRFADGVATLCQTIDGARP